MSISGGIIDCHIHPNADLGSTPEETAETLLRYADRMGIEMMGLSLGPIFHPQPTEEQIEADNTFNANIIALHPDRFFGYANINPNRLYHALSEISERIENGPFIGIKLWIAMCCTHPNLDPICERAAELGVPILQHTFLRPEGNLAGESSPADLVELAARHPDTTFIGAHTGFNWEQGAREFADQANIVADTCGGDPDMGFVETAVRWMGADRVLYGSDAGGRSFATQLAKVHGADISDADKEKILRTNAKRVLNL